MSTPALTPSPHPRTNWIVIGIEIAPVLAVAGFILLNANPFWHLNEAGFLNPRVHGWNFVAEALIALGVFILVLSLTALIGALLSRCFACRPFWPYIPAFLALAGAVAWLGQDGFTRDFDTRFEWSSADGFTLFQLQPAQASESSSIKPTWQSAVGLQVEPQLRGYFHVVDWQRVKGHIGVRVTRWIPVAWPIGLGQEGESLEDPDETPLMQAADKGDLKTLQQLLADKPDLNARDQSGQTALIHACRNPRATPSMIQALVSAGADINIRSRNDYTALGWATARGNTAVIQLLRRAGARP